MVKNEKDQLILIRLITIWHVCMDYQHFNSWMEKTIFLCCSWINCWIDLSVEVGIVSSIGTQGIIKSLLPPRIKKRLISHVPMGHLALKDALHFV